VILEQMAISTSTLVLHQTFATHWGLNPKDYPTPSFLRDLTARMENPSLSTFLLFLRLMAVLFITSH
jgi:hypothetical protein